MSGALHLGAACLLLASHTLFLLRGLSIQRGADRPRGIDRVTRALSQLLLPAAAVTGAIRLVARPAGLLPHGLLGLAPLAAIPVVFVARLSLHRRTQWPWLLPVLNLVLIAAAFLTGLLLASGGD
jgi:hypothetical protein